VNPTLSRRLLAEAAGTAGLVGIGTGAIVFAADAGGAPQWLLAVAWFAALAVPAVAFAPVSGAQFNPAITVGLWVAGRHPGREVGPYVAAQCVGAFAASAVVLGVLGGAAHLGATLPAGGDLPRTFVLELAFTALLGASVAAAIRWAGRLGRWGALLPSAVVGVSTWAIGPLTGSSLNPARSVAPAVLSSSYEGLWVYVVATAVGAGLGLVLARPGRPGRARPVDP
jgi:glycerol uptake facilitator-like aquaporin